MLSLGLDPYDEKTWGPAVSVPLPSVYGGDALPPCPGRYGYPLWTAVALIPLGVLPIEAAATLWLALSLGSVVAGLALTWRAAATTKRYAALFAVAVIMSQPFWTFVLSGQISGLIVGVAGATLWSLARRREALGGVTLLLGALKPQLVALTVPASLLQAALARRWRFVVAAVATGIAMVLVPVAFVPGWPIEWLGEVGTRRLRVVGDMPTAWGFANHILGDARWGALLLVALVGLLAWLTRRRLDGVSLFVLSLPLSLLATPYAWSYDHLVLAVAWGFIFARAASAVTRGAALLSAGLLVSCVLPWVMYALSFSRGEEALTAIVPALTAVTVAFAMRAATQGHAAPLG